MPRLIPVCSCAFFLRLLHTRPRVPASTRPSLRPLIFEGLRIPAQLGRNRAAGIWIHVYPRHCLRQTRSVCARERSDEAIHRAAQRKECFAFSLPSPGGGGLARMSAAKCETGWGDLSTWALLDAERPSPRPAARFARVDPRASFARLDPLQGRVSKPHNSLAFENANELTRRVFSSRISVRVIGGSARWLQFSRSQSRQLTPIGVPSAFSRSIPAA